MRRETLRKFSAILAAAVMVGSGFVTFADTPQPSSTPSVQDESGNAGTEPGTSEPQQPSDVEADIRVNYIPKTENEYEVKFTSWTSLKDYKDIAFTVTLADGYTAEISSYIQSGSDFTLKTTTSLDGNKGYTFSGCTQKSDSLRPVLCTVMLKSNEAPTDGKLIFKDFSAKDKDDKTVKFTPVLTVKQGTDYHKLNKDEQALYDEIISMPAVDKLSFYQQGETGQSKVLADITALSEKINDASDKYKKLSDEQKKMFDDNLAYDNKTLPEFDELIKNVSAMTKAYDVIRLSYNISSIKDDSELLKNMFVLNIYDKKLKATVNGEDLNATLKSEFDSAVKILDDKTKAANDAFEKLDTTKSDDCQKKLFNLESELTLIQTNNIDKFYNDYLDDLLAQANAVKDDIQKNFPDNDITKSSLITYADNVISKIKAIQNGAKELPVFEVSAIDFNYSYTVKVDRKTNATPEAKIKVEVYNKSNTKIDGSETTFGKGVSTLNVELLASNANSYPIQEDVTVKVYYVLEGAEFYLGSQTRNVGIVSNPNKRPEGGSGNSGGSGGNSGNSGSSTGGTKFPSNEDKTPTDVKPIEPEKTLFNDIANYDWAKDAIEGLYYAGVINGMDEGIFNPAGSITREQFCKMVVQLFGVLNYDAKTTFNDVKTDAWYTPYIASAINAGYIQGQSNEYFGVGESIMRQDMATILYRALGESNSSAVLSFTDTDSIAPYAKDAISQLVGLKIINGYEDGTFKPRGTATRAEAAKMIWGVYNLIKK